MPDYIDTDQLKRNILSDMRVELADEFDRNFERKAFFTRKWKPRRINRRGSLLIVTGALRRSIKAEVKGNGVAFTSNVPYAVAHNEGLTGSMLIKAHSRRRGGKVHSVRAHQRRIKLPERRFIGDGPQTQKIIRNVIEDNLKDFNVKLTNFIRQK